MDLQTLFYIIGILFMLVVFGLLIGIGIASFLLVKKMQEVTETVSKQAKAIAYAISHPGDIARDIGVNLTRTFLKKAQQSIKNFRKAAR